MSQGRMIIPIATVHERENSYEAVRSDTGAVLILTKKYYVKFYPARVEIPVWYAKKLGLM